MSYELVYTSIHSSIIYYYRIHMRLPLRAARGMYHLKAESDSAESNTRTRYYIERKKPSADIRAINPSPEQGREIERARGEMKRRQRAAHSSGD